MIATRRLRFTLVELLVVVAIFSMLIGLLMPALRSAMSSAYKVACANGQKEMGTGIHLYANDHDELVPLCCGVHNMGRDSSGWRMSSGVAEIFSSYLSDGTFPSKGLLNCPASETPAQGRSDYVWNANNYGQYSTCDTNGRGAVTFPNLRVQNLWNLQSWGGGPVALVMDYATVISGELVFNHDDGKNNIGVNVVVLDGSVAWYTYDETWHTRSPQWRPTDVVSHAWNVSGGSRITAPGGKQAFQGTNDGSQLIQFSDELGY